jgi:uncharacterized OsmC-like protein
MSSIKQLYDDQRAAFRDDPAKAAATFAVESRLVGGFQSSVQTRQFRFHADEPESIGGEDSAPNPVEYLLASLATCQEVTYRLYADALGIPVDGISVKVEGALDLRGFLDVDDDVRPGYLAINGTVTIDSPASGEELARLKRAVDRHCPVLDSLRNPTPVELTINHVQQSSAAAE